MVLPNAAERVVIYLTAYRLIIDFMFELKPRVREIGDAL